jgi:hypothetical protein
MYLLHRNGIPADDGSLARWFIIDITNSLSWKIADADCWQTTKQKTRISKILADFTMA